MKLRYSYHSEHNADKQDRWIHFILFLGAIALLLAAAYQLYVHFTGWQTSGDDANWHLMLGLIYLMAGLVVALWGMRLHKSSNGEADRYARIDEERITWDLTQIDGEQTVRLENITKVERTSVRDLELTLTGGGKILLPIYLIANEEKQEELLKVLWEQVPR